MISCNWFSYCTGVAIRSFSILGVARSVRAGKERRGEERNKPRPQNRKDSDKGSVCVRVCVRCLFTRLVCVSGDSKPSEASPQSISINKSSVGGPTAAAPPPPPTLSYSSMQRSKVSQNSTNPGTHHTMEGCCC